MKTDELHEVLIKCWHHDISADEALELIESQLPDDQTLADAKRMRWILNGNGYFMEEEMLCGHAPCDDQEQNEARRRIDAEISIATEAPNA